jgi:pyruvate ferredoxin oxidoreductase alpha subunit
MTETPIVLVEAQRAGPSTGMPTKTGQGDLEHVLYSSQSDSDRIVFAPGNVRESYEQTRQAFQLAYEYQMPAIILYDDQLTGEYRNVPRSFFDRAPNPDLGSVATEEQLQDLPHDVGGAYERFSTETDGVVNPRSLPGQRGGRFLATGNEHWPDGQISEDTTNRIKQVERRIGKIDAVREELRSRESPNTYYGDEDADFGILTWGSQKGVVSEAIDRLNHNGIAVKGLGVSELAPFPKEAVTEFLESVDEVLVVEMNATGQFKGLVRRELGDFGELLSSLLKYNGNPMQSDEIVEAVEIQIGEREAETNAQTTLTPREGGNT